jgi:uncharacterized DUF497 family protein
MRFEWDERKNKANQKKHGLGFEEATFVFRDKRIISVLDDRYDYGEERWVSTGSLSEEVVVVVAHTVKEDGDGEEIIRIISARKATRQERRRYHHHDR